MNNNYSSYSYSVAVMTTVIVFIANYGDLRIVGGCDSGQLQFDTGSNNWGAICTTGFDDEAGDVACRQLGYVRPTDVYTYS